MSSKKLLENTNICKMKKQKNHVCKKMERFHRPGKQKYLIKGVNIWNTMLENLI